MNHDRLTFHKFFRELRTRKGISLRGFCTKAFVDPANISRMERGLSFPPKSGKILERYADALGLGKASEANLQTLGRLAFVRRRHLVPWSGCA